VNHAIKQGDRAFSACQAENALSRPSCVTGAA
jgi:hypothetical protein